MKKTKPVKRPQVGVAVIIRDGKGRILLGKRKNVLNAGLWSLPGGHFEWMETFSECCRREVREEVGIEIRDLWPVCFTNDMFKKEDRHYVTLFFEAKWFSHRVTNMEPEKCYGWKWFQPRKIPKNTWHPVREVVREIENAKQQAQLLVLGEDDETLEDEA